MRVRILERLWNLRFVSGTELRGKDGDCDAPTEKNKQIRVWEKLSGEHELEITVHELLHAADWHKDEDEWIKPVAKDLARILWRLGWRKNQSPE